VKTQNTPTSAPPRSQQVGVTDADIRTAGQEAGGGVGEPPGGSQGHVQAEVGRGGPTARDHRCRDGPHPGGVAGWWVVGGGQPSGGGRACSGVLDDRSSLIDTMWRVSTSTLETPFSRTSEQALDTVPVCSHLFGSLKIDTAPLTRRAEHLDRVKGFRLGIFKDPSPPHYADRNAVPPLRPDNPSATSAEGEALPGH